MVSLSVPNYRNIYADKYWYTNPCALDIGEQPRKRIGSKARPELIQRLCAKYGDGAENMIKSLMHVEFNNGRNRYQDLNVWIITTILLPVSANLYFISYSLSTLITCSQASYHNRNLKVLTKE